VSRVPTHPSTPGLVPSRALLMRAAEALASYAGEIEAIGEMLCGNAALVEAHLDELQAIDRLAQCLDQLALVFSAPDPDHAVASITIGTLQKQLSEGLAPGLERRDAV
jgi:hypothetical protein